MLTASQLSRSGRVIRRYFLVFFGFFFSFRMPVPFAMSSPPLVGFSSRRVLERLYRHAAGAEASRAFRGRGLTPRRAADRMSATLRPTRVPSRAALERGRGS